MTETPTLITDRLRGAIGQVYWEIDDNPQYDQGAAYASSAAMKLVGETVAPLERSHAELLHELKVFRNVHGSNSVTDRAIARAEALKGTT